MLDLLISLSRQELLALAFSLILLLLSLAGGRPIRRLIAFLGDRVRPFTPEWLHILGHGFKVPLGLMLRLALIFGACLLFPLPDPVTRARLLGLFLPILRAAAVLLTAWGFWRASPLCRLLLRSAQNQLDLESDRTISRFLENIYRVLVLLFAGLVVMDLFGLPVTSLIAGAGIAGLAVSLAAQSTLSNLIAGATLVLEHPFGIGDYVALGDVEGVVEDISFRSTRLRTPDNVLVTVENAKVCGEYIRNSTSRVSRLWQFTLSLTYQTDPRAVETFVAALEDLLRADAEVDADTVQVILEGFGASSLDISVRLYATALSLADYRALKHRLNVRIIPLAAQCGCAFAYPTATVVLEGGERV